MSDRIREEDGNRTRRKSQEPLGFHYSFVDCISYFLVAAINYLDQKQFKKQFILAYVSRGKAHSGGRDMAAGGWSRNMDRSHQQPHTREHREGTGSGVRVQTLKTIPQGPIFSTKALHH